MDPSVESTLETDLPPKVQRDHPAWAVLVGFVLAYSEIVLRLLMGKDLVDAL